jgi:hypothetical protein
MAAGKYDILIEQGATFRKEFQWLDKDNNPVDIADYSARMKIKKNKHDKDALIELTSENEGIEIKEDGIFILHISAEDTAKLVFSEGVYDMEFEAPDGAVTRLLEGSCKLSAEVTDEG